MPDIDLAAADPAAEVVAALRASPEVKHELGLGPDDDAAGYIGDWDGTPYPRLIVSDPPGGTNRNLRWLMAPAVQLEAVGDLSGKPGKAQLRRILYTALQVLATLPDRPTQPGRPVITNVESNAAGGQVPLPDGRPRYLATVLVSIHPPQPVSEPVGAAPGPVGVSRPPAVTVPALGQPQRTTAGRRRGGAVARGSTRH